MFPGVAVTRRDHALDGREGIGDWVVQFGSGNRRKRERSRAREQNTPCSMLWNGLWPFDAIKFACVDTESEKLHDRIDDVLFGLGFRDVVTTWHSGESDP